MKKSLRIVTTAVVTLSMAGVLAMTGCSSSTQTATESEPAAEEQTASEPAEAVELQIFAANSLSKAMEEVQALYSETHEGVTFADTQYKSSGELNEMLAAGSSADILISASKSSMDTAVEGKYVDESTRFDMFVNDLVMVGPEDSANEGITLEDIASGQYSVAVGDESVPAGNYACQALSTVGCYISADGTVGKDTTGKGGTFEGTPIADKVVLDTSVGNVCKHAESGDVDVAFVYSSDVFRFGGVKVLSTVPEDTHKSIVYPAAVCADSEVSEAAAAFLEWAVTDEDALKIWQEWGFELA